MDTGRDVSGVDYITVNKGVTTFSLDFIFLSLTYEQIKKSKITF